MKYYTLGFAFNGVHAVAMVQKLHGPAPNIGKWNGIGDKVKLADQGSSYIANEREFREETTIITPLIWVPFAELHGPSWKVSCFKANLETNILMLDQNDAGEALAWIDVNMIFNPSESSKFAWNVPTLVYHALHGKGFMSIQDRDLEFGK